MIHPICHGMENNGTAAPQYLHVFLDYYFLQATPQAQLRCVLNEKTQTWINGMEKLIKQKLQNISIQLQVQAAFLVCGIEAATLRKLCL